MCYCTTKTFFFLFNTDLHETQSSFKILFDNGTITIEILAFIYLLAKHTAEPWNQSDFTVSLNHCETLIGIMPELTDAWRCYLL